MSGYSTRQTQTATKSTTATSTTQAPASAEKQTATRTSSDRRVGDRRSLTIGTNTNDRTGEKFADTEGGGIRDDELRAESESGFGGWISGLVDSAVDTVRGVLAPQDTQLGDLPPELLEQVVDDTTLRFAFSPTDMEALALGDERKALEMVGDILTVNNPSPEVMEYLLQSERFTDLVWSGHGSGDGLYTTGSDGEASLMDNETIAGMLENSSIKEVFFAVCNGGDKLDTMVNDLGIDTYAYNRAVRDDEALGDLQSFVANGDLEAIEQRTLDIDLGMFGGPMSINLGGEHQRGRRRDKKDAATTAKAPTAPALSGPSPSFDDGPTIAGRAATGFNLGGLSYA